MIDTVAGPITFTPAEVRAYYLSRVPHLKPTSQREWRAPCPVHQGRDLNFSVDSETGLATCHSQCGRGWDILGLHMELTGTDFKTAKSEVFGIVGRPETQNGNGRHESARGRIVATYDYTDENGKLLYQAVRYDPKDFRQRQPDGKGGWVWNIKGVRLVLYRLPDLLECKETAIFVCEGEKDVHSLESLGMLATCNPMGADKWRPEYAESIRGRRVVILPDNDESGRRHTAAVAAELLRVGCKVHIIELPGLPAKGDVSDWIAAGGTLDKIRTLYRECPVLTSASLAELHARWGLANEEPNRPAAEEGGKAGRKKSASQSNSKFRVTEDGVFCVDDTDPDKEPLKICGRLEVSALTRDSAGDGWGRLLRWDDAEGRPHSWAMPMSLLAGDGSEYRSHLLDGGLFIAPGRNARERLTTYIQMERPEALARCVSRVGWRGEVFVLPDETVGPKGAETVLYQPPFEAEHYLNVSGTVNEWRTNIGELCAGNSRLVLAASCAFAGPILSLVGAESGGVHLVGTTSTGKSTALMVGGSVLGGGGRNGFSRTWRATANGLEAIAELHNDLVLVLDEISQVDPKEAAEIAYLLANGSGKTRMTRSISTRKTLAWKLLFLSAGELTLADHAAAAGKRVKGGAEIRLLTIDADGGAGLGLFEDLHGAGSADLFARQLKDAAQRFYGTPLRAYLDFLTHNRPAAEKAIRNFQADFLSGHVPSGASGEVFRAGQRFALIAAAGELATSAGITGWAEGEATKAAARCFTSWIENRGTTGGADTEAAIRQVRRFLEAHGASRFQVVRHPEAAETGADSPDENQVVVNRAGFRRKNADGETEYLIMPEAFKAEVCAGFDYRMAARALVDRGFLDCQPPDLTKSVRLPGNLGKIRAFCIRASILEG